MLELINFVFALFAINFCNQLCILNIQQKLVEWEFIASLINNGDVFMYSKIS